MKKFKWLSLILVIIMVLAIGCSQDEGQDKGQGDQDENLNLENEIIIDLAETFIDQLSDGDYQEATENFDATMADQIGAEDLEEIWLALEEQLGNFIDQEYSSTEEVDEYSLVLITGIFNDDNITFQVTFNEDEQIAGFFIR